jgi:hypothetical protein
MHLRTCVWRMSAWLRGAAVAVCVARSNGVNRPRWPLRATVCANAQPQHAEYHPHMHHNAFKGHQHVQTPGLAAVLLPPRRRARRALCERG